MDITKETTTKNFISALFQLPTVQLPQQRKPGSRKSSLVNVAGFPNKINLKHSIRRINEDTSLDKSADDLSKSIRFRAPKILTNEALLHSHNSFFKPTTTADTSSNTSGSSVPTTAAMPNVIILENIQNACMPLQSMIATIIKTRKIKFGDSYTNLASPTIIVGVIPFKRQVSTLLVLSFHDHL
jgi:hypothetical protein